MRAVGNVIWLLLSGLWLALTYTVAGDLACVFIVIIPLGLQPLKLARYALWPFGKSAPTAKDALAAVR